MSGALVPPVPRGTPDADWLAEAMVLDIESRSELDIKKVPTQRYVTHASTRILCLSAGWNHEDTTPLLWLPDEPAPTRVVEHIERGRPLAAWYVRFDSAMCNQHRPRGMPLIATKQIHDIAAQAAAAGLPRGLDACAKAMDLALVKDPAGYKAMLALCKPSAWRSGAPVWNEDPTLFALLGTYCQNDVVMERILLRRLPVLQLLDRPVFLQDHLINERGIRLDAELLRIGGPALIRAQNHANRQLAQLARCVMPDAPAKALPKISSRDTFIAFLKMLKVDLFKLRDEARAEAAAKARAEGGDDSAEDQRPATVVFAGDYEVDGEDSAGETDDGSVLVIAAAGEPEPGSTVDVERTAAQVDQMFAEGASSETTGDSVGTILAASKDEPPRAPAKKAKVSTKGLFDKAALDVLLAREDLPRDARTALLLRKNYHRTSTARLHVMALAADARTGRIHDCLTYHAASTGRAGGRWMQPQNLPRDSVTGETWSALLRDVEQLDPGAFEAKHDISVPVALMKLIRGAIIPADGHHLLGGDLSKIEICVGAWLAGETELLARLEAGADVYKELASTLFNVRLDEVTPLQRQIAKSAQLGAQYGLGAHAFVDYCAKSQVKISEAAAVEVIAAFRAQYPGYPRAWRACGDAALQSVMVPGLPVPCLDGKLVFRTTRDGAWMTMELPSGRRMRYRRPRIKVVQTKFGERDMLHSWGVSFGQWREERRFGSALYQNAVQSIARDQCMFSVLQAAVAGLRPILHVHDEILCEPPRTLRATAEALRQLMQRKPAWARDIPVDAKCWAGTRYGKEP